MSNVWMLLALVFLAATACMTDDDGCSCRCPKNVAKYYTELGCLPVHEPGVVCPTNYDCSGALGGRTGDKCYLRGQEFEPGTTITSDEIGDVCVPECRCRHNGPHAEFRCVTSECPELFEGPPPDGCVRLYAQDRCCSTATYCANSIDDGDQCPTYIGQCTGDIGQCTTDIGQCEYAGRTYVDGEVFYPREEPCKKCICQEGFDGTLDGPWCWDVNCGIELYYGDMILAGCAPVFWGTDGCCPIDWRCPSITDTVVPAAANGNSSASANTCSFGALSLGVCDSLNKQKACVECTCAVPPHVTCVQTGRC